MEDVIAMGKKFGNISVLDKKVTSQNLAKSISDTIDRFGIHRGGVKRPIASRALDTVARQLDWDDGAKGFVSNFGASGEGKRILFTARQRLHSNVRIMRQCRSLNDAGFDVHLVGINEGPSDELRDIAPDAKIDILQID